MSKFSEKSGGASNAAPNNILLVCVKSEDERNFLYDYLLRYLQEYLKLIKVTPEELDNLNIRPKAVLASPLTEKLVTDKYPDTKVIFAGRVLNGSNLEELIMMPPEKKVLVVNNPKDAAIETAEELKKIGINHLMLTPYWPDCGLDISDYDTAIYAGIRNYCPENREKYINIGNRNISISSLMEIVSTFDIPYTYIDAFYNSYIKTIVDSCYKLKKVFHDRQTLLKMIEQVSGLSKDISISVNHLGSVTLLNPVAEDFFNMKIKQVEGEKYQICFAPYPELVSVFSQKTSCSDSVVLVKGRQFLVTINTYYIDGDEHINVNMKFVDELEKSESNLRKKLHAKGFEARYDISDIIGNNESIKKCKKLCIYYAKSDAAVMIMGESGTGKELFAQAIHNNSKRAQYPFVAINFAALPENLADSELFGYVEGAFTGAARSGKRGLFEIAHKGTIFLDEIGDASLSMQVKLLRVLEEKEIMRVGDTSLLPIDVRIVCATNKNLKEMMQRGTFREDLYYRLKMLTLKIPPLRERREDIFEIIRSNDRISYKVEQLPVEIKERFLSYRWPGNIRELKAMTELISLLSEEELADVEYMNELIFEDEYKEEKRNQASVLLLSQTEKMELVSILQEIKNIKEGNCTAGRYSLANSDNLMRMGLTEAKIKLRLRYLEECGMIVSGRTKQGVSMTAKGERVATTGEIEDMGTD